MNAGTIVIGTDLNTDKLEKKYQKLEQKLKTEEIDLNLKFSNLQDAKKELQEANSELVKVKKTYDQINQTIESKQKQYDRLNQRINSGDALTGEEYNRFGFLSNTLAGLKGKQQEINKEFDKYNEKVNKATDNLTKIEGKYEQQKTKVQETKNELEKVNRLLEQNKSNSLLDGIKGKLNETGNSLENIIHKVTRWGLALFGIRSAYSFITSAVGTLSQYNQQLATDVSYMRFALASVLQPIIEGLINLAYKLLTYINYIAYAWFRVNLFANATTEAFQKTNKAVAGTNQSAKELKKTLTGFDEMNILQENGSVGSGGGGGGIELPSVDLSNIDNIEVPKWLEWIAQNKETVLGFFRDMIALIATMKIASFLLNLTDIFSLLSVMSKLEIFGMLSGIIITLVGIYNTIRSLITFIADPTWANFVEVLKGLETILIGVGLAMVAFNATNPIGWIVLAVGAIGGLITILASEETQAYNTRDAEIALEDARQKMTEATNAYVNAVDQAEQAERNLQQAQYETGISIDELLHWMQTENKEYKDLDENQRRVYKAYLANEGAQKKVKEASEEVAKANIEEIKRNIENQLALAKASGEYTNFKNSVFDAMKKNKISTEEASKYMTDAMKSMSNQAKRTFLQDIPEDIKQAFDTTKFGQAWRNFEYWWNRQINSLDTTIRLDIEGTGPFKIQGTGIYNFGYAKGGLFYPSKLPKLAVGGIINRPGAGVPYHGATIGERGAEAVVPLTDSQQMAILGEMIGKYITVNANIVNTMNGRVISRELQQIRNNEDFAYNR